MISLYSKDYLSGRVWYPKDVVSKMFLEHITGKDRIDDKDTEQLETLAELHNLEVSYA